MAECSASTRDYAAEGILGHLQYTSTASSPSHNMTPFTTQHFADFIIGGQAQGNQEEGDTRSGCLSHGVRVCLLPVTAPLPSQPDGLGGAVLPLFCPLLGSLGWQAYMNG